MFSILLCLLSSFFISHAHAFFYFFILKNIKLYI
nr:MAG TPA: hypothetical protein [Caudoviricetes sp.]